MPDPLNVQFRQAKQRDLSVIVRLMMGGELSVKHERFEMPLTGILTMKRCLSK
jgi:hypothetical protein